MISKAIKFATGKHEGQVRKYTGEPYIFHPLEVAAKVIELGGDEEMVCAAILHDTVEDTDTTLSELEVEFGRRVSSIVYWLTDQSKKSDGNRKARKEIDRAHIGKAPACAQLIKCADLISNTKSIKQHDHKFWKVYKVEKLAIINSLHLISEELRMEVLSGIES